MAVPRLIRILFSSFYSLLGRVRLVNPSVIVMIDGGICSQMHQFMMGEILRTKGKKVEFDLSFYKTGLDLNGIPNRSYVLETLFPDLKVKRASNFKIIVYKVFFRHFGKFPREDDMSWQYAAEPVLLSGYYSDIKEMYAPDGVFKTLFRINDSILSDNNKLIFEQINHSFSVGVHVRRGDLTKFSIGYGCPVSVQYLRDSIKLFLDKNKDSVFFFFTDDKDYVRNDVLANLDFHINYIISDSDSLHVYEDLVLLSKCKCIITSKGTMGKYAALLGDVETIVLSNDDNQRYLIENLACSIVSL